MENILYFLFINSSEGYSLHYIYTLHYLFHSFFHMIVGAVLFSVLLFRQNKSFYNKAFIIFWGACIAISPDVTKVFGDIWLHSIFLSPFIGMFFGFFLYKTVKDISYIRAFIASTVTVILGHLMVDVLGNGNGLFYPIMKSEIRFSILDAVDGAIVIIFAIGLLLHLFWRRRRSMVFVVVPLVMVLLLLAGQTFSRVSIQNQLNDRFSEQKPQYIDIYDTNKLFRWYYIVRIDNSDLITGWAEYFTITEQTAPNKDI